jgi:flagellar basal-body rod modification protein FlgD
MVNSVAGSNVLGPTQSADQNATSQSNYLRQQDFLRIMVAQMQNQDPLDPQSQSDFLSQLAQFSTNDSINNMQSSINQLASSLQSNMALQASALVGRKVLVNSSTLPLGGEGGVTAGVNIIPGMGAIQASVYSSNGELIKTISLEQPSQQGVFEFSWDGTDQQNQRAAAGTYTLKVSAAFQGQSVALPTMIKSNVDSVSLGQNGSELKLNVAGLGQMSLNEVIQISV